MSALTGADVRRDLPIDTVDGCLARLRALATPTPAPSSARVRGKYTTVFADQAVAEVLVYVDQSGLVEWLQDRVDAAKKKQGRPSHVSVRALLTAMLLAALHDEGCVLQNYTDILYGRISPAAQRELHVLARTDSDVPTLLRRQEKATYAAVRRTFHTFIETLNPAPHRSGRKTSWDNHARNPRPLTDDELAERRAALDHFTTTVLAISLAQLPPSALAAWDGSACVDATVLPSWSRGRAKTDTRAATDPTAGYHVREGNHDGETTTATPRKKIYGHDLHIMVSADITDPHRQYAPSLAIALATGRPGVDPAGNIRRMLAALHARGHRPGYLAGDGLYTDATPDTFQTEARRLGWRLLPAFTDKHLGINTQAGHALAVEGDWYCPSMPKTLTDATIDYRAGRITETVYKQRIAARTTYRMRPHEKPRNGKLRLDCPASGACPQAKCPLKPASLNNRPTTDIGGGNKADLRPEIVPTKTIDPHNPPPICRQQTVAIDADANARWESALPFGSDEYDRVFKLLRSAQEGYHGFVKDQAHEALADPGKRRVAGIAANTVFASLLLFAGNLRKIASFQHNADTDQQGRLYVTRTKVTNATSLARKQTAGETWQPLAA